MATPTATETKPSDSPSSREIAASGGRLADLLAAAGNGIRLTGLVLIVGPPKEVSGVGKGGRPYSFLVQELQIFTGTNTTLCKFQGEVGDTFPEVIPGQQRTFKVDGFRMNGNVPVLGLSTLPE